jgi:hypothetical protein
MIKDIYKRPGYISFLSILGIAWSLLSFLYVFSPGVKKVGIWFPAVLGIIITTRFIAMIGVWHMKKWGIMLFFASVLMKLFISVLLDQITVYEVVISLFLGISLLFYFNRMDDNL